MAFPNSNVDTRGGAFNEIHRDQIVNHYYNDKPGAKHYHFDPYKSQLTGLL
jgi:hypothetical protein